MVFEDLFLTVFLPPIISITILAPFLSLFSSLKVFLSLEFDFKLNETITPFFPDSVTLKFSINLLSILLSLLKLEARSILEILIVTTLSSLSEL